MPPSRRDKAVAHANRLLDDLIGLRTTYAFLRPILFDQETIAAWGGGRRAYGLNVIKTTLLEWCVLEIAKIALDQDDRTPSLRRLDQTLDDPQVLDELREEYAVHALVPMGTDDPEVLALVAKAEQRDEANRRIEFDQLVARLRTRWTELSASNTLAAFGTMRDKVVAHSELQYDGTKYAPLDIASLGLQYGDLRKVIVELDALVDLVNLVFRGANYDFDGHDKQLAGASAVFWQRDCDG